MDESEPAVVVIGGGILGVFTTLQLAEDGYKVRVYVAPDPDPRSESQRNQSMLHSGLFYTDNIEIARRLFYSGGAMHEHLGRRRPTARGLFRFTTVGEERLFLEHAGAIRLRNQIKRLSDRDARDLLGSFYTPDRIHYRVPDCPFHETVLMEEARRQAKGLGADFREARARIVLDKTAPHGYAVLEGERRLFPGHTIVCAGTGTPRLLESIEIDHHFVVHQSNLLVIDGASGINVPLLADRSSGLTVVAWNGDDIPPHGCIVVGDGNRRKLRPEELETKRSVWPEEQEALLALLPPALATDLRNGTRPHRFTAGHKVDVSESGRARVASWIHCPSHLPGLIFAVPGKATLSSEVAQSIVDSIGSAGPVSASAAPDPASEAPSDASGGGAPATWDAPIQAHFESTFKDMDERAGGPRR